MSKFDEAFIKYKDPLRVIIGIPIFFWLLNKIIIAFDNSAIRSEEDNKKLYDFIEKHRTDKPDKKSNPFGTPSKYVVKDTTGKILFDKKSFKSVYHAWDYIHKHHPNEDENNYRVTMKGIK